ncbi:DUF883 domain-containing protein [Bowmanella dokdonensis]|uniref:DUF883 domain-containing protein n=1 Tax=Bowmanella dokdonensis TaxID=751969 RepID=A0A939IRN2_9ALTE|nr:DUF883 domain-containing protein [Bowmanella dokdonensis]MBN7825827.1 DUF883 domain-containing protein [Bowmanella dokdonensis]
MATATPTGSAGNGGKSPTTERATKAAHEKIDEWAERASSAEETVRRRAADSNEALAARKEELKRQIDSTVSRTNRLIADHPLASAGVAFAAGALFTYLMRRK